MSEVVLEVKELKKSYGDVKAVKGISYSLYKNEILGVLGPNGAGKTTTINCLCGILPMDSGNVWFKSKTQKLPKEKLGLCPQELIIWKNLTLLEQLNYVGSLYKIPKDLVKSRSVTLLKDLGLFNKANKLAKTLSGGMKRRLNIALSLLHDPEILVLDEPEAGLDPQSRILVRDFIKRQADIRTVILTTHNMDEAERLSTRLILIDHGVIIEEGTSKELKNKYNCKTLEDLFIQLTGHSLRD